MTHKGMGTQHWTDHVGTQRSVVEIYGLEPPLAIQTSPLGLVSQSSLVYCPGSEDRSLRWLNKDKQLLWGLIQGQASNLPSPASHTGNYTNAMRSPCIVLCVPSHNVSGVDWICECACVRATKRTEICVSGVILARNSAFSDVTLITVRLSSSQWDTVTCSAHRLEGNKSSVMNRGKRRKKKMSLCTCTCSLNRV